MSSNGLLHRPLRLSERIAIETSDADGVVVYHADRATRLRLNRPLYEMLQRFAEPAAPAQVAPERAPEELGRAIETLVGKGFLVPADAEWRDDRPPEDRRLAAVPATLFNCPRRRPGDAGSDVAVLGVPFDLGTSTWAGARWAPAEIRKRSLDNQYRVDFASGRPLGWFDVQHRRRILEGVTFGDWGDVAFQYGEPTERIYERIGSVVAEMAAAGSFPLLIGGDQSIAYSAAEALSRTGPLVVLYLDAHTDFKPLPPGSGSHNHSSTARRIVWLPGVRHMVQVGHRGYTLHDKVGKPWEGMEVMTLWDVRDGGPQAVVDRLPADARIYVSMDVNVLDPLHAPANSNLTPGGFTPDELKALLLAVGASRRVVGMDFCGVNPERDLHFVTARTACHLLFAGLGAALAPR
jgi:agmatinase